MAELRKDLQNALTELRKEKERKFDQTVELIINLQKFDVKKNQFNTVINLPYKIKDKKIAAFLETKSDLIDTITKGEFKKYSDKKEAKKMVKKYDFFLSQASLMPLVASTFGKVLGPAGKMPSPQLGLIMNADEKTISGLKDKVNTSLKIRIKEASVKIPVGKQSMKDEEILENVMSVYGTILKNLPREKENIKNIEIKFTMSKPQKIKLR